MNEDILSLIEYKMPAFSKGQKRIAALIRENFDKAAFMTASALGKQAGVSESTVVRFAAELGYGGYPQMQKAMQDAVMNRLTAAQRMGFTNERLGSEDVLTTVLHNDMDKLRQSCDTVDRDAFQDAVQDILKAGKLYIIGARSASALAQFFGYYMKLMLPCVQIVTASGAGEVLEQLINVAPGDAVVAFSFPRYAHSTVEGLRYCHSAGARVIGITNSAVAPMAHYCDRLLAVKSDMISVVDSLVAPMSLVNALIVSVAAARKDALQNTFERLEGIWSEHHIYDKKDDAV